MALLSFEGKGDQQNTLHHVSKLLFKLTVMLLSMHGNKPSSPAYLCNQFFVFLEYSVLWTTCFMDNFCRRHVSILTGHDCILQGMAMPLAAEFLAPLVAAWEVICADYVSGLFSTLFVTWAWRCLPLLQSPSSNTARDIRITSSLLGEVKNMSTV